VLEGGPIAVVKDAAGDVFAIGDTCTHGDISLAEGFVEDDTLECWAHGSKFELTTGKPTGLPATEPVATFPVDVRPNEDGTADVYVDVETFLNGVTPR
jgi:3-phenylpropionate/trans-cinnamate dioxygenase ferredoxin subunit